MNNKGFTLIELLATVTLLAILMMIAVPNVIGVVSRNKNKTYIEDSKKLVSLAEYKVRSQSKYKPSGWTNYCFTLAMLGEDNLDSAPGGGCYDTNLSFVRVTYGNTNQLKYYVQIIERENCDKDAYDNFTGKIKSGVPETISSNLFEDEATKFVKNTGFKTSCAGTKMQ